MALSNWDLLNDFNSARQGLIDNFDWFLHVTHDNNIDGIRSNGLIPHADYSDNDDTSHITSFFGDARQPILCLWPVGAELTARPTYDECRGDSNSWIFIAVHANDLPERMGIDYSYENGMQNGIIKTSETTSIAASRCAIKLGSIASYDLISASKLRILSKIDKIDYGDPSTWPNLERVSNANLLTASEYDENRYKIHSALQKNAKNCQ